MRSIIILLRILFLLISFYGYLQFFRKYLRPELIPGFLFCAIGSTVFLGGILNILSPTAWCIAFAGVFLACFSLYKQDSIRRIFSWGTLFFAVGIVFFLLLLFGCKFTHYDNFSHWAVAPKIMIETNRFPNHTDLNYEFQSYPLGSSAFIYYFVEISGLSAEWFQMFAQAVLLLGLVSGIFVFTTKSSSILLAAAGAVILMSNNIDFVDLLVDTLLPLIGLAGIFFCHYYKDDLLKKLPFIIPYSVFLISVKNSGIFYVAAIICLALFYTRSDKNKGIYKTAVLFSPFISLANVEDSCQTCISQGTDQQTLHVYRELLLRLSGQVTRRYHFHCICDFQRNLFSFQRRYSAAADCSDALVDLEICIPHFTESFLRDASGHDGILYRLSNWNNCNVPVFYAAG